MRRASQRSLSCDALFPRPLHHPCLYRLQAELVDHSLSKCIATRCADADWRLVRAARSPPSNAKSGGSKGGKATAAAAPAPTAAYAELERRWLHLHQLRLAMSSSPLLAWTQAASARFMLLHLRAGFECELYHADELGAVFWNVEGATTLAYRAAQRLNMAALLTRESSELRTVTAETRDVRAAGYWVNPLALEIAGSAAALVRFEDPAAGLAELSAASLRGTAVLAEGDKTEVPGSEAASSGVASGGAAAAATAAQVCASPVLTTLPGLSAGSPAAPLSDSEKADVAQRAAAATAGLHERLANALSAARDSPPWNAQLLEAEIYAARGCVRLLAACQLAGLWRGMPDDDLAAAAAEPASAAAAAEPGASVAPSQSTDSPLPDFDLSRFLPARPSSVLYARRFRDFSTFLHPAPPSWDAYVDAYVRQPLADAPMSLAKLLATADECFIEAHSTAARLVEQLAAVAAVGPDGVLPVLTLQGPRPPPAESPVVAKATGKGKRAVAAPPALPAVRTVSIASSSAEVLGVPALLVTVTRLAKATQANRVAGLAIRKDNRAIEAMRYYAFAAATRQLQAEGGSAALSDATSTLTPPGETSTPESVASSASGHSEPRPDTAAAQLDSSSAGVQAQGAASALAAPPSSLPALLPFGYGSALAVSGGGSSGSLPPSTTIRLDFSFHPYFGVVKLPSVIKRA